MRRKLISFIAAGLPFLVSIPKFGSICGKNPDSILASIFPVRKSRKAYWFAEKYLKNKISFITDQNAYENFSNKKMLVTLVTINILDSKPSIEKCKNAKKIGFVNRKM
jgi:hypothetical protein